LPAKLLSIFSTFESAFTPADHKAVNAAIGLSQHTTLE
jgi:hypothetical protein